MIAGLLGWPQGTFASKVSSTVNLFGNYPSIAIYYFAFYLFFWFITYVFIVHIKL